MAGEMLNLPTANGDLAVTSKDTSKQPVAAALSDVDADLQARLENLRRE